MKNKMFFFRVFPHSILLAITALAISVSTGCRTDDPLYERYAKDGKVVECNNYYLLSLTDGRYIRKINETDWACGDYDTVGRPENVSKSIVCDYENKNTCCTKEEIALAREAMTNNICTAHANNCVPRVLENGELSKNNIMCSECAAGQIKCGEKCVNTNEDSSHCGSCSGDKAVCDFENKHETCVNGECNSNCDGKICITNGIPECKITSNDNNNCGDCGVRCNIDVQSCQNGKCIALDMCDVEQNEITCFVGKNTGDSTETEMSEKRINDDDEKICIHPKLSQYCGAKSCSDLGTKCDGGRICNENMECKCPSGHVFYNEQCMDPSKDSSCGATETSPGVQCTIDTGYCKFNGNKYECLLCNNGRVRCGDKCIDPLTDEDYCGADHNCNSDSYHKCNADQSCHNGVCLCNDEHETSCGNQGSCINLSTIDVKNQYARQHCGASTHGQCNQDDINSVDYKGVDCTKNNEYCVDGECKCISPSVLCGNLCVNPLYDNTHCGVDNDCSVSGSDLEKGDCTKISGSTICSSGTCRCTDSQMVIRMDTDGPNAGHLRCVDTSTDFYHCGLTGFQDEMTCEQGQTCENGFCIDITCPENMTNCAGKCINATDYHVNNDCSACAFTDHMYCDDDNYLYNGCFGGFVGDNNNCTSCGNVCPDGSTCVAGKCLCNDNSSLCYDSMNEGYCLNLNDLHLNSCDACADGWMDTDNNLLNGCELDLSNKVTMCGKDKINCSDTLRNSLYNNCINGQCEHGICNYGYGDCDDDSSMIDDNLINRNGCETRLDNQDNCGACGNICSDYYSMNGCVARTSYGTDSVEYKCCYKSKTEFDFSISEADCCDSNAKIYRKCATALCWGWFSDKDKWQCATEKPSGWH